MARLESIRLPVLVLALVCGGLEMLTQAWGATPPDSDPEWAALLETTRLPPSPAEWRTNQPTASVVEQFRLDQSLRAAQAADHVAVFRAAHPDHARLLEIRQLEYEMNLAAVELGGTDRLEQLASNATALLEIEELDPEIRYRVRSRQLQREASHDAGGDRPAMLAAYERAVRQLVLEFPARQESWRVYLFVASRQPEERRRAMLEELAANPEAPSESRLEAEDRLRQSSLVGRPLELKFTALDGSRFDLADLRGKVVLIDFWATWCTPWVAEFPALKDVYERHHKDGLEIVGVNLDSDRRHVRRFLRENGITWPQHFDGRRWDNEVARRFQINSLPVLWLVDRQGVLRELNAREGLRSRVESYLNQRVEEP